MPEVSPSSLTQPEPPATSRTAIAILIAIALAALALRLWYIFGPASPGGEFAVVDPDNYTQYAAVLARFGRGFRWSLDGVRYFQFVRAPLYPVVLAVFDLHAPGPFPLSAAVAQAVAGTLTVIVVFWMALRIHSARAGLIAAVLMAIYLPAVIGASVFSQEGFYIPLAMLACAMLVDASARSRGAVAWAAAGLVFGLAALTRSLAIYYVPIAALLVAGAATRRADGVRRAAALLAGAALAVLPYSIYISRQLGEPILIENMGSIHFGMAYPAVHPSLHTAPAPTLSQTVRMFARAFWSAPLTFIAERLSDARGLFQLRGGRWLQLESGVPDRATADHLKWLARMTSDLPFVAAALLAPIGWALARRRREASLVAAWILMNVGLVAAFTFSGARYRSPVEPTLAVLGAVALAGGWQRPRRAVAAASLLLAALIGAAVWSSARADAFARAEYGVIWSGYHDTRHVRARGDVGVNVAAVHDAVTLRVWLVDPRPAALPAHADVRVNDRTIATVTIGDASPHEFTAAWRGPELAPVEVRVRGASGERMEFQLEIVLPP